MTTPYSTADDREAASLAAAAHAASAAATAAGVEIALLSRIDDLERARTLINRTWAAEMSISTLRALSTAGNFVSGAYRGDVLVGAIIAFFGSAGPSQLHSHIAVVDDEHRRRGTGFALKLHQRAWAMRHGVSRMCWTYDPIQRRNAHVNLTKLGARPSEYLENFYGDYGDSESLPFPTDRLMVEWALRSEEVVAVFTGRAPAPDLEKIRAAGCATLLAADARGAPVEGRESGAPVALVATPPDASALLLHEPALALEWRLRVRGHLKAALAAGARITGFTREGFYVVERHP